MDPPPTWRILIPDSLVAVPSLPEEVMPFPVRSYPAVSVDGTDNPAEWNEVFRPGWIVSTVTPGQQCAVAKNETPMSPIDTPG
jgi:hypothetical protein